VDNDGYDDVLVGASNYSGLTGRAYLFPGSATGVATTAATTLTVEGTFDYFARSLSGAGDVNGDGYADVMVGVPRYDDSVGRAYVYLGSESGVVTATPTILSGGADSVFFGGGLSGAGDVNGDGYADVIVGAYGYDDDYPGRAFVYAGSARGLATTAETTLVGEWDASFGYAVADAGDVNGDGYGDVIVGADASRGYEGAAYVYLGYGDADGDGVAATVDCDDTDASVGPASTRYVDADGDGHGGAAPAEVCASVGGYAATNHDCDDTDPAYHPGAVEADCSNPNDYNCDGSAGSPDDDGDGWAACLECDDTDADVHPDATELCNEVDDNCDGTRDESATDASSGYLDVDGDGFTDPLTRLDACAAPEGYIAGTAADCDDANAVVFPGATDVLDDGIDQDCDGADATERDTGSPPDPERGGCSYGGGRGGGAFVVLLALGMGIRRRR
jgi:hypothetical protein